MTVIRYAQPPGIRALGVENFPENGLYEAVEQGISLGCPLAPSRWKLRRAIAVVNQTLAELRVRQHPDKTYIGRISRGFDFLGSPQGLAVASGTVMKFVERMCRLYEQGADAVRIGDYVRRWKSWATATGLHVVEICVLVKAVGSLLVAIDAKTIPSDQCVAAGASQRPAHWPDIATLQPTLAPVLRVLVPV